MINQSNGAPLFTITETRSSLKHVNYHGSTNDNASDICDYDPVDGGFENVGQEDGWQLL